MWIKELPPNYLHCRSGMINLNGLWHDGNIYVMDNHRVAAWCWLQACDHSTHYSFLHIDQHSDLMIDNSPVVWTTYHKAIENPSLSLAEYLDLRHADSLNAHAFRWDNYIRPIHGLLPNWFSPAYFAYTQAVEIDEYERKTTSPGYNGFLGAATRLSHQGLLDLLLTIPSHLHKKWIINLDIDYFYAKCIRAMGVSFVEQFGLLLNNCLPQTQVLTIALSPSCCNPQKSIISGWRNSIRVFDLLKKHLGPLSGCELLIS